MPRPERLVLITGTGTEVGKTWVAVQLARLLRSNGMTVAARKPAQSFAEGDAVTDASLLADATSVRVEDVCPPHRWYPVPLAPPMAADALGRPRIALDDLVAEIDWPPGTEVGLVESAGGLRSPIAHDGDSLDLASRLGPDLVLLVADPALGVVSNVRLAAGVLAGHTLIVLLNHFDGNDEVHARSLDWLRSVDGLNVLTEVAEVAAACSAMAPAHPATRAR
ncbi:MAG: ATP-dependent dethiobiotin synthetase BioD [Actinomycetota bacterium]